MTPYYFLTLGLLLVFMEFFLPGAVMGVAGGVIIVTSIFLFAAEQHPVWMILIYIAAIVALLIYLIKFALWRIRHEKGTSGIYLSGSQEGYVSSQWDATAVGKQGTVLSDLKPGGYIIIDGIQHQALSQGPYISKGSIVQVIGGQEESLIVKLIRTKDA